MTQITDDSLANKLNLQIFHATTNIITSLQAQFIES